MKARLWMAVVTITALLSAPFSFAADEKIGVFEVIRESSLSYDETIAALDAALAESKLMLHAKHDVRVPGDKHRASVFVVTSPDYAAEAANESPRTVSAQVLRIAVYTQGDDQTTLINMANPVAHAMVFYANSKNYDKLVAASREAAAEIRAVAAGVAGTALSREIEPARYEKHYRKFKGDGPARMMAKFRTFEKSQLLIKEREAGQFDDVVAEVKAALQQSSVLGADDSQGWEEIAAIPFGENAVYIGVTNPYIEDKMVRINSRFRSDGKSDASPFPGVDHVSALPTEILVVKEGGRTLVLHYGQMWRMQLYFWDSGYRAFTANVGVPSRIANSIEDTINASP